MILHTVITKVRTIVPVLLSIIALSQDSQSEPSAASVRYSSHYCAAASSGFTGILEGILLTTPPSQAPEQPSRAREFPQPTCEAKPGLRGLDIFRRQYARRNGCSGKQVPCLGILIARIRVPFT